MGFFVKEDKKGPKYGKIIEGAEQLSLGVSIVVAVLLGVGVGYWLRSIFGYEWLFWMGTFWGIAGAFLNIYKVYKKQVKEFDEFKDDVRYKNINKEEDEEDI